LIRPSPFVIRRNMRVISGSAKGRKLRAVPGEGTRPIGDRVKEALFDILAGDVVGADVLDLFAGTGGVGIEALSRGARHAVFVESGRDALATIQANLRATGLASRAEVIRTDVFVYLANDPRQSFHIIYIAPPQYEGLWARTLRAIDARPGWLAEDGVAIAQIHPKEYEPLALSNLELVDQRRYGSTILCFYERSLS
jgi:16S rRNA (guanine(966)-N(2))-methyltransferase RsmD